MTDSLERSRQELDAARVLADAGFPAQAVSRAYDAAFFAAEAALLARGETRSKHSGAIAAFIRIVVRDGGAAAEAGQLLRSLFDRRNRADCCSDAVPMGEADRAIADAGTVLAHVEASMRSPRDSE